MYAKRRLALRPACQQPDEAVCQFHATRYSDEETIMKVLVIGAGAREHALVWKLAQSQRVTQLYAAPGNPGMAPYAQCLPLTVNDFSALADFAERNQIDLT